MTLICGRLPDLAGQWLNPEGRAPDAVISLPVIHVEPTGEVPYIQQLIKVPVAEDKWIVAMQLRPGNRNLLHHMGITEVALPEGMGPAQINEFAAIARKYGIPDGSAANTLPAVVDPTNADAYDMLGVYTPGSTFEAFTDDSGKLLKGGKELLHQLQHTLHDDRQAGIGSVAARLVVPLDTTPASVDSCACRCRHDHRRRQGIADRCSGDQGRGHRGRDSAHSRVRAEL